MPELRSGIAKSYGNAFILEEDSLRRIQAVLEKSAMELQDQAEVFFRIEREDDRFYETKNIDDVLSDPNIKNRRIGVVYIILTKSKPIADPFRYEIIVQIKFTSEEKYRRRSNRRNEVELEITHENRNWALLLADELDPQIQRTLKAKGFPKWMFLGLFIPAAFVLMRINQKVSAHAAKRAAVIFVLTLGVLFSGSMMMFLNGPPRWYLETVGPESVFLWGDEAHAYAARQRIRQNMFWGVVVAFVVSFAAGGLWLLF